MHAKDGVTTVAAMTLILFAGKGLGLVRDMLFAAVVGGGELADAFMFASVVPRTLLDAMFAAAITASFIPVFNDSLTKFGKEQAFALANSFLNIVLAASAVVVALGMLFAPAIAGFGGAGFAPYYANLAANLLRLIMPLIVLGCAAFTLVGILQSFGQFYIPAAMSLLSNIVIIAYYVLFFGTFGIYGLAAVFLLGWVLQLLVQIPFLRRYGYRYRPRINVNMPGMSDIFKLLGPAMLFTWVLPVNLIVNTFAVTHIVGGSAAIGLSNTVYTIVTGVFVLSVANVIFPRLSRLAAGSDDQTFGTVLRGSLKGLLYLLVPMSAGLAVVSPVLVRVLFQRGEFTPETSLLTSTALSFFAAGIVGFGAQNVLARGFFSCKDGRTPLITGITAVALNLAVSFGLVDRLGIAAPALGSALAMTLCGCVLFAVMYRRNPAVWNAAASRDAAKMAVCAVPMSLAASFALTITGGDGLAADVVSLILAVSSGAVVYLALTYALAVSEARMAADYILGKLGKV
ncbi:MAG: murein biosynthesis integral membrane protein MurJ [Defluviitaleaceae bacterium]|nr:murein biosynthesis integral membrane protein MurJ [Defluviitaleaceae bacterium]